MRFLRFAAVLAALLVLPASIADAGAIGSATVDLSNFQFQVDDGGGFRTGTGNFNAPAGAVDFSIRTATTTYQNQSSLSGFANGFTFGGSIISRSAAGGSITPFGDGPLPGTVSSGVIPNNFTRAASNFGGSFLDLSSDLNPLIAGQPSVASANNTADFNVNTQGLTGDAKSDVSNSSTSDFVANFSGNATMSFNMLVQLALADTGIPAPGWASSATSSVSVTLQRNRNGVGTTFGLSLAEQALLNQTITQNGVGGNSYDNIGNDSFSIAFDVQEGDLFSFTIQDTATVALAPSVIPEPGTVLSFVALGAVGLVRRRRRKA